MARTRCTLAPMSRALSAVGALVIGASSIVLGGCSIALVPGRPTTPHPETLEVEERSAMRCVHGTPGRAGAFREELDGPVTDLELMAHLEPFDARVRRTAVAAGLEPLLARVMRERDRLANGSGSREALLAMRDELSSRMFALQTQLLAMEFEVDCVRNLINGVLSDYQEAETDRQLALTIASLVVGAGTGIASSLWDVGNSAVDEPLWEEGPFWTAIVGAAATTALGVAVLVPEPAAIVYVHEHNVLAPIVAGEDPELIYPTFIFRMLTLPVALGASPRDELVGVFDDMLEERVPDDRRALARAIVFGGGGIHDVGLLQLHQDLLEELGASLDMLAQDIDLFGSSVAVVLSAHEMAPDARRAVPAEPEPAASADDVL